MHHVGRDMVRRTGGVGAFLPNGIRDGYTLNVGWCTGCIIHSNRRRCAVSVRIVLVYDMAYVTMRRSGAHLEVVNCAVYGPVTRPRVVGVRRVRDPIRFRRRCYSNAHRNAMPVTCQGRVWRHVYTSVVSGLVRTPHRVRRTSSGAGILAWCLSGSFWGGALWSTPDSRVSSLTRTVSLFRHRANPSPHAVRCFLQSRTLDWR